mgnify:CR=1 FL=1
MPVDKMGGRKATGFNAKVWKLQMHILRLQMHRNVCGLPPLVDWGQMIDYIPL